MKKPLIAKERLRATPNGAMMISSVELFHGEDSDQKKKILAHHYTKLVQDNPEFDFGIIMNNTANLVTVSWNIRE